LIALTALVLSIIALGCASFSVWQNNKLAAIAQPKSEEGVSNIGLLEVAEKRFVTLEAKIAANGIRQQQAIIAISKRIDQQAGAPLTTNLVDSNKTSSNNSTDKNDTEQAAVKSDQRFVALEMAVKDLTAAMTIKPADGTTISATGADINRKASSDFSVTRDQASLLIVSGLLADNMAGAPLNRWIDLMQVLADQGVSIPNLDQLRIAATPTPKRSLSLIRIAYDLVPRMTEALNRANDDAGFLEKTSAKLGQLVRLREIGDGADRSEIALREFEAALAIQDLDEAVRAAGQWSGPDIPSLKNWMGLAQSRRSLDRAVSALVTDRLASALAVQ
jgi:hypothetical protein